MGVLRGFERRLEGAVEGMFARAFKSGLQPIELAKAVQRYCGDHKQVAARGVVAPNDFRFLLHPDDLERMRSHGRSLHRELASVVAETCEDNDWNLVGTPRFAFEADEDILLGRCEVMGRINADTTGAGASGRADRGRSPAPRAAGANDTGSAMPVAQRPDGPGSPGPQPHANDGPGALFDPPSGNRGHDQPHLGPTPLGGGVSPARVPSPDESGSPAARPDSQRPRHVPALRLEVLDTGAEHTIRHGRHTIGRGDECDLTIDATTVSRKHAVLLVRGDTWWVFDLGSTNGTKVNGKRASELPIQPGDRVRIGTVDLLVREV